MQTGMNNLKDFLDIFVWLVGAGSLIYAANSYKTSQKQLNFAVIISCTERFQKIMPQLKSTYTDERERAIKAYVDLCNEELFYFKHDYLPKEIIGEWLDGMIYYLPYFKNGINVNNSEHCLAEIDDEMLEEYPQIKEAFEISGDFNKDEFNLKDMQQRKKLVENIKSNLKNEKSNNLALKSQIQRVNKSIKLLSDKLLLKN